jgi:hypothetical protein
MRSIFFIFFALSVVLSGCADTGYQPHYIISHSIETEEEIPDLEVEELRQIK